MVKSLYKSISGLAACIGVVASVLAIATLIRMPSRYWGFGETRQLFTINFLILLLIIALAILVAVGASKLGTANDAETSNLRTEIIEIRRKMHEKDKEMDTLRKKVEDLRKVAQP